jgi:hypothetical protein
MKSSLDKEDELIVNSMNSIKPTDVAMFMLRELQDKKRLYQENIVHEIKNKFGSDFYYINENGNLAISKKVLNAFNKLKKQYDIEWDSYDKSWILK